jgi:uncharacterized alpha-E superfamily protein
MISRVAESCYWLHRYMERAESTARLLQVNRAFILDAQLGAVAPWQPILHALGDAAAFTARHGADAAEDGECIQDFLVWDEANPSALVNSMRWARENARTIRETISVEMWQSVNAAWLWLAGPARRLWRRDPTAFYERAKGYCQLFQGYYHSTMLYALPFDFMRIGALLERSDQTTRVLHGMTGRLAAAARGGEHSVEGALCLTTLRSCAALESFVKLSREPLSPSAAAAFLLFEPALPRSVLHCLDRCHHFLDRVRPLEAPEIGRRSAAMLDAAVTRLRATSTGSLAWAALPDLLDEVLDSTAALCEAVQADFFEAAAPLSAA